MVSPPFCALDLPSITFRSIIKWLYVLYDELGTTGHRGFRRRNPAHFPSWETSFLIHRCGFLMLPLLYTGGRTAFILSILECRDVKHSGLG